MSTTLIEGKDGRLYSDAFLSEIRELNQTLFRTVRTTLERTPFADCRQTLKDYVRLYEETEVRYNLQPLKEVFPGSKRTHESSADSGYPIKSSKFANGGATVVIKEEDEEDEDVKPKQPEKEKVTPFGSKDDGNSFASTNSGNVASTGSSLHRATGTSSLLAPIPMAFNFKPTVPASDPVKPGPGPASNSLGPLPLMSIFPTATSSATATSTATSTSSATSGNTLPLLNLFPAASSSATSTIANPTTSPPKFAFTLPTANSAAAAAAAPATTTQQALPSFSFFSGGPFAAPSGASNVATNAASNEDDEGADGGEDDTPPEPEKVEVHEDGSFYKKPCQLFFKPIGGDKTMHEKGAGFLFLKRADNGIQLLVRASNALRTVLLNIMLGKQLPLSIHGKQSVRLVCVPNPPLVGSSSGKPTLAEFFFKCDSSDDQKELFERLQKERQADPDKSS